LISDDLQNAFTEIIQLTYGHLGDSNIHLTLTTGKDIDLERISEIVYRRTGEFHGSISGEHGIGTTKKKFLTLSRSESEIELMQKLKILIDPNGILNPGRVLP
jgi:FAD/FMN-containing dehydrogenase